MASGNGLLALTAPTAVRNDGGGGGGARAARGEECASKAHFCSLLAARLEPTGTAARVVLWLKWTSSVKKLLGLCPMKYVK